MFELFVESLLTWQVQQRLQAPLQVVGFWAHPGPQTRQHTPKAFFVFPQQLEPGGGDGAPGEEITWSCSHWLKKSILVKRHILSCGLVDRSSAFTSIASSISSTSTTDSTFCTSSRRFNCGRRCKAGSESNRWIENSCWPWFTVVQFLHQLNVPFTDLVQLPNNLKVDFLNFLDMLLF